MDKQKIKKIIAREGLLILGCLLLAILFGISVGGEEGTVVLIAIYPPLRFAVWAIQTLTTKEKGGVS